VVHNDLALRNILVFSTGQVKVSDFGLAHYVSQNGPGERLKGATLPLRWMPPEGIFHREYSLKSDVYELTQYQCLYPCSIAFVADGHLEYCCGRL
jgi:serine/threonine protein kinase